MEKIKKGHLVAVLLLAVMMFGVSLSFAAEHYVIETSSSVTNQTYTGFNQTEEYYHGGVFYVQQGASLTVNSSQFYNNSVSTGTAWGGAIYNSGTLNVYDSEFSSNTAKYGGAILNEKKGTIKIGSNAIFSSNTAERSGGAIYNEKYGIIEIGSNAIFSNNTAQWGGAIINFGEMTILSGTKFIKNKAGNEGGGAIRNRRDPYDPILNLIAETGDIEFTGNTANGVSNAIHDYNGIINMWTSNSANIVFNDRITSEDNTSIMNINRSSGTLPATGKVILNEDMTGYTGQVNLYNGTIALWEDGKFFGGELNVSNLATINLINNRRNTPSDVKISTFSGNALLEIDANLNGNFCLNDIVEITDSASGSITLSNVNVLNINLILQNTGRLTLFSEQAPSLNADLKVNYGGTAVKFSKLSDYAVGYEKLSSPQTFKEIVNDTTTYKVYNLTQNETITEDLKDFGGKQLIINGNGYDITGNGRIYGIRVGKYGYNGNDKKIIIENVGTISGFKEFIDNSFGSIIEIGSNITFSNNYGNLIWIGKEMYGNPSVFRTGSQVIFSHNTADFVAGAIFNHSSIVEIGSNNIFYNNYANLSGGAIRNFLGTFTVLSGTKFIENEAGNEGGAIDNEEAILNLIAESSDIEFTGNTANGISNAIHDSTGTINMWTNKGANIVFNDRITSADNASIMNINKSSGTLPTTGKVILNEDMTGYTGKVNLYNGTIALGENGTFFGGDLHVYRGTIDFINEKIQDHNFNNLTVTKGLTLAVDADLKNKKMDTIYAQTVSDAGMINIKSINILSNAGNTTEIMFTSSTVLKDRIISTPTAFSALYKYDVVFDNETGFFSFTNAGGANPAILSGAVASAAGGFTAQKAIIDQSFASLNNFASKKVQTKANINRNLYVSAANKVFESENKIERGLWIRPYASQDTVKIGDADIDNTLYGTLAGIDLPVSEDKQVSFYIGYAGSKQDFEEIKVTQTGYIAGASGMMIKDKWYAGLTANINFNKAESDNDFGTDEFDMNMYAIAAKAGYDIEAGKNWTIEPNIMLMYGSVNRQGYTTKQGAKIKGESDNNIIVAPQVKAKLDLDKGLKPYALLGYVLNAGDKIKVEADGLDSEADKADGYVEYGIGLNKEFINTPWSCYVQVTGKGGDRSGFDGSFGVKYNF